jgi:hypothetical protein
MPEAPSGIAGGNSITIRALGLSISLA